MTRVADPARKRGVLLRALGVTSSLAAAGLLFARAILSGATDDQPMLLLVAAGALLTGLFAGPLVLSTFVPIRRLQVTHVFVIHLTGFVVILAAYVAAWVAMSSSSDSTRGLWMLEAAYVGWLVAFLQIVAVPRPGRERGSGSFPDRGRPEVSDT